MCLSKENAQDLCNRLTEKVIKQSKEISKLKTQLKERKEYCKQLIDVIKELKKEC